jgi:hypothetical protein
MYVDEEEDNELKNIFDHYLSVHNRRLLLDEREDGQELTIVDQ